MRDSLWINPNGTVSVVQVDDEGNLVAEPALDLEPETAPAGKSGGVPVKQRRRKRR